MDIELISLLESNGYTIYQTKAYFIIRKKVFTSFWVLLLFVSLGLLAFFVGTAALLNDQEYQLSFTILFLSIGVVLMLAPFFNYLTAPYRSLVIDLHNETILFRSGYSRAYLFTEVKELKLEVMARQTGTDAFSNSNKEFHYTISAYMNRGDIEELIGLKFRDEESERQMFKLKDYFQALLVYSN